MRFGFIYLWRDSKRNKYYLGSHLGELNDGYVGSNKRLMCAYKSRPETFKRRILEQHDRCNLEWLRERENRWLSLVTPEKLHNKYYNEKTVAAGGDIYSTLTDERKRIHKLKSNSIMRNFISKGCTLNQAEFLMLTTKRLAKLRKKKPGEAWRGRKHSDESRKRISEAKQKYFENNPGPMLGKNHADTTKKKVQINNPNRKSINTPYGQFLSAEEFAKKTNLITACGLRNLLKTHENPISKRRAERCPLLTLSDIGKTPKEIGYYYK